MRAVMVMFDSLNRRLLPNYGCTWTHTPNFERLGQHTVTFDNCYVGSMPCMPARRELHTGRYNFLHRSWGPIEPFDDSMPEILDRSGVCTHLVSDHQHYWEDGGCTYHTRYSSWEISRGQEGDTWKGMVHEPEHVNANKEVHSAEVDKMVKKFVGQNIHHQDKINREYMTEESKMPQAVTFKNGLDFIKTNHKDDNWFLQIETFDPHEPFFASERFKEMYPDPDYIGDEVDWPPYAPVTEDAATVQHIRKRYAALLSMCDYYLGQVLDAFDKYDMWKDTMLIVNTDHGFLLGEHDWWAKSTMPLYNEIAHIPFFVWDPRTGVANEHRNSLVQTIDLAPTLLEYFNTPIPKDMQGHVLKETVEKDTPVREYALYGFFGKQVNITDGTYCYMRGPVGVENGPLYEYTLMPTHMRTRFSPKEFEGMELVRPFNFTKNCSMMKLHTADAGSQIARYGNKLFNIKEDPGQLNELDDLDTEVRMLTAMRQMMQENNAPAEQYIRLGIPTEGEITQKLLVKQRADKKAMETFADLEGIELEPGTYYFIKSLLKMVPESMSPMLMMGLMSMAQQAGGRLNTQMVRTMLNNIPMQPAQKALMNFAISSADRTK